MKYLFYPSFIFLLFLGACTNPYKKGDNGYEYRIIAHGNGQKPVYGNFIQYHIRQEYKNSKTDTLLSDSRDYMIQIASFDSMRTPLHFLSILNQAGAGDSIVIRISTDSAFNRGIRLPANLPRGGYVYTTIKLLNVFTNADLADSAKRAELRISGLRVFNKLAEKQEREIEKNREQLEKDSKIIKAYLEKNNISYVKGKWGSFVVIHEAGTGEPIAYNDVAAVNYTGKTLDSGKVFDSNTDPKFHNPGNYEVTMGAIGSVMPGWTDALFQLRNGAKATLYLPSSLAFGKKGFLPWIKPNDNVIYELEIKNVITEDRALEIMSGNRRRAEADKKKQAEDLKIFK